MSEPQAQNQIIDAIDHAGLARMQDVFERRIEAFREAPCETPEQEQWWSDALAAAQAAFNDLEAGRKELTRPLLDAQRRLNGEYAKATGPIEEFRKLCKARLSAYALAAEERRRALVAVAEVAAQAGDHSAALAAVAEVEDASETRGVARTFSWRVVSFDVNEVPREFLTLDEKAVKAYLKKAGEEPNIAGVVLERSVSTRTTGKK